MTRRTRHASSFTAPALPHVWNGQRMVQACIIDPARPEGQRLVIPSYQWIADAFTRAAASLVSAETALAEAVTADAIMAARAHVTRARAHRDACGELLLILPGVLQRRTAGPIA